MTKEEHIRYWLDEAEDDWKAAQANFENGKFHWALFIGHLALEKSLKAFWVKNNAANFPLPIHNLVRLAETAHYPLTPSEETLLLEVNKFNIAARYPDYKREFKKRCTRSFADTQLKRMEEFRQCILKKL